jgi:hypothetical protein
LNLKATTEVRLIHEVPIPGANSSPPSGQFNQESKAMDRVQFETTRKFSDTPSGHIAYVETISKFSDHSRWGASFRAHSHRADWNGADIPLS